MANGTVNDLLNLDTATKDSAQARLSSLTCILFTGATAPQRIAKFIREYVNAATLNNGNWTITDQGLPSCFAHTIYYSDGMWYLFFNHHAPYDAANFPFNKIPNASDEGFDL